MKKTTSERFIAHCRKNGEEQGLDQHLLNVSFLARMFAQKIGLGPAGELIGLLHDLGKYSAEFQQYLRSAVGLLEQDQDDDWVDSRKLKGKIDHSTAGAQMLWSDFQRRGPLDKVIGEILSVCIASHHSGLIDCLGIDGTDLLLRRMQKADLRSHRSEAWSKIDQSVHERYQQLIGSRELSSGLSSFIKAICRSSNSETVIRFKVGMLVRFLFSCLLDADRIDTADFEHPIRGRQRLHGYYEEWPVLLERLERHLLGFDVVNPIDHLRRDISAHCSMAAERERGIFTLTIPTGGGKTLASLRFALRHAARHQMDRVVFVVPYTSIIDQNAEEVRKIFEGSEGGANPGSIVLEHHSNLVPEQQTWRNKILAENWDAPIVFTTSVQILETLFGAGTRGARRMHQLANTIIVFDEIQTLPVKCTHLFNNAINFLVEQCESTVVLCTATQPLLDRVDQQSGAIQLSPIAEIMPNVTELFEQLTRVEIVDKRKAGGWTNEEVAHLSLAEVGSNGSCLVIVNTKSAARTIYQLCKASSPDLPVYHLSTNMCPTHRKVCLNRIRELLKPESASPVLCISTQLIEAGVDVDFGAVVRFIAGLDSIAQAAGRCNRHGRRSRGTVYIVNPAEDSSEMIADIRIGRHVAERVLHELALTNSKNQLLSPEGMNLYFNYYFFERRNEMTYPVNAEDVGRDDTLLNLLSENKMAADGRNLPNYLRQSFMTAAGAFKSIDAPTQGVIVPYEAGSQVIAELSSAFEVEKQFELLRRAQQYTVNVFPSVMRRLEKEDALHEVQEGTGILYLDKRYYDPEFGLSTEPVNLMEMQYA